MTDFTWFKYMELALREAEKAYALQEVPVGALIVDSAAQIVATAYNLKETVNDPLGHAEMLAIRQAALALGKWRLGGCTLVVTLEPCPMCASAIVAARLSRVVYGVADLRLGAAGSVFNLLQDPHFNHRVEIIGGIMAEECRTLLQAFFQQRRQQNKAVKESTWRSELQILNN